MSSESESDDRPDVMPGLIMDSDGNLYFDTTTNGIPNIVVDGIPIPNGPFRLKSTQEDEKVETKMEVLREGVRAKAEDFAYEFTAQVIISGIANVVSCLWKFIPSIPEILSITTRQKSTLDTGPITPPPKMRAESSIHLPSHSLPPTSASSAI